MTTKTQCDIHVQDVDDRECFRTVGTWQKITVFECNFCGARRAQYSLETAKNWSDDYIQKMIKEAFNQVDKL